MKPQLRFDSRACNSGRISRLKFEQIARTCQYFTTLLLCPRMVRCFFSFLAALLLPALLFAQSPVPSAARSKLAPEGTKKPATNPAAERRTLIDGLGTNELTEALKLLRQNYIDPGALNDSSLSRAQLDGLLLRLGPGAQLVATATVVPPPEQETLSPFRTEVLDGLVGYVRLGTLSKEHLAQ